jgi:hypothetical protein
LKKLAGSAVTRLSRSMPPALFYRNAIDLVRTTKVAEPSRPMDHVSVRWGRPGDEDRLRTIHPGRDDFSEMFAKDRLCTIAEWKGEPASYAWFDTGDYHDSPRNAFRLRTGPASCFGASLFIRPKYRLSGIFVKHWFESMSLLAERGIRAVYYTVALRNPLSIRSHARLGFEPVCRISVTRVAGLTYHRVTAAEGRDGPSSHGWGVWDGSDPLEDS